MTIMDTALALSTPKEGIHYRKVGVGDAVSDAQAQVFAAQTALGNAITTVQQTPNAQTLATLTTAFASYNAAVGGLLAAPLQVQPQPAAPPTPAPTPAAPPASCITPTQAGFIAVGSALLGAVGGFAVGARRK